MAGYLLPFSGRYERCFLGVKQILIGAAIILILSGATAVAQNNPPVFDTIFTTGVVAEGDIISWDISATDPDLNDTVTYFIDPPIEPPYDDSVYKGDATFQTVGEVENFLFTPFYDWTDAAPVVLQITFGATDGIDTARMPVSITVEHFNPPPEFDPVQDYRTAEGVPLQFTVRASDPDGAAPILNAEPIPANATFRDVGFGYGVFDFTPDATQYGDTAQDYLISFIASDGEKADTAQLTIRVVGPYVQAFLTIVPSKTVAEGTPLEFDISGEDPNNVMLELGARGDSTMDIVVGETVGDTIAHLTYDANYVKQDTTYTITLFAYNGRDTTFHDVLVTVTDSMNYPPVFAPVAPDSIYEGIDSITDLVISAADPEGNPVSLVISAADTAGLSSVSFVDNHDNTGLFNFAPTITEGGDYDFRFIANDYLDGENDAAVGTLTVAVKVLEVDNPPQLKVVASGNTSGINEGGYVRFDISATDPEQGGLPITITPAPDSNVYKGNVVYAETSDSTATFEFYPGFNQVTTGSDTTFRIIFSTQDTVETVSQQAYVTVYDVPKGNNDPWQADTLTLLGSVWDSLIIPRNDTLIDTLIGFEINARIWNDSNITAGMTGFRWSEPWLKCDTVRFGESFVSGPGAPGYLKAYIDNDSLAFQPEFVYTGGTSLPPVTDGTWDYFTARFVIDTTMIDMNTIHIDSLPKIRFRIGPYGTNAGFLFDKKPQAKKTADAVQEYLAEMAADSFSYPPLTSIGDVRSANDSVKISLFDVQKGVTMGTGDVLYMYDDQDSVKQYQLRISVENRARLSNLSLGYRIYSGDGAVWEYGDIVPVVNPFSRMAPDTAVWPGSGGLTMTGWSMDGSGIDSLVLSGDAGVDPERGLSRGLMQYIASVPFTVGGVADYETKAICFDILSAGPDYVWNFTRTTGDSLSPGFSGAVCFPVKSRIVTDANDQGQGLPLVYSLEQNYPNPFNATTTIKFRIPRQEHVRITVYNVLGQTVSILADQTFLPGEHRVVWDGCDHRGKQAATGIYLYQIKSEGLTKTRKMILLK